MDRREMEKLMDKYKQEMLDFQRKNNIRSHTADNYENAEIDEREKMQDDALRNNTPYERDRSDPLPMNKMQEVTPPEMDEDENEEPAAVPAQVNMPAENQVIVNATDNDVAAALRRGCTLLPENTPAENRAKCRDINDFLAANEESGTLKVEAFVSDRAFGVPNARVMVFLELPSGNVAVFDGLTDIDGVTDTIRLPAPPKSISQSPQSAQNPRLPYSVYSVYVEHPYYVRAVFTNVPVFSGVDSVQPVRMLAKAEGLDEPTPIVVDESSQNTLRNER